MLVVDVEWLFIPVKVITNCYLVTTLSGRFGIPVFRMAS